MNWKQLAASLVFASAMITTSCAGTMATVTGDLSWTGQPTSDGGQTWPATLLISFQETATDGLYDAASISLGSSAYTGAFLMTDFGMTSATQRFFGDGEAELRLTMDPLSELTAETLQDVTNVEFQWAHPSIDGNDVAPVSWLVMEGPLMVADIPEPGVVTMVGIAGVVWMTTRRRYVRCRS